MKRANESYDRRNYNLKIKYSYFHFKNIQKIIYRKPDYQTNRKIRSPPKLKINIQPYNNYFVMRDNELYKKIISNIRDSKVKPKINNYYKLRKEKIKE